MALSLQSLALGFVIICVVLFVASYLYLTRNFNFWKKHGIRYVKPTPFFGNLKDVVLQKLDIGHQLQRIYSEHREEPYVGIFAFDQPALLVKALDLVKNVLVKDSHNFVDRILTVDETVSPLNGKSLIVLKGQRWRHVRTNLTPTFTSGKMKRMFHLVQRCAKELTTYLDKTTADGSPVQVKEAMARFGTDVIASCALGIESNSLVDPDAEFRRYLRRVSEFSYLTAFANLTTFFAPALQSFFRLKLMDDDVVNFFREAVWGTVRYRERYGVERKDFLDNLMELRKKGQTDKKYSLDGDDFVAQAFAFLIGGFETSGNTMSIALYELALHPDIQHRLRMEITQVLTEHNQEVTYDAIQEMKYLDMVVSETLRKYPVVPFVERKGVSEYELPTSCTSTAGSVTLPAGVGVYIPVLAIHYDVDYYQEPNKFDPERFAEENKKMRPEFSYLPFGKGPRNCIGMRFALMQIKTALIHILSLFQVESCKDTPVPLSLDPKSFILQTVGEIPLIFNKLATPVLHLEGS